MTESTDLKDIYDRVKSTYDKITERTTVSDRMDEEMETALEDLRGIAEDNSEENSEEDEEY